MLHKTYEANGDVIVHYNKAVRDKIPQIIRDSGKECKVMELHPHMFVAELERKLMEELDEFFKSKDIEELADMVEVIYAIVQSRGMTLDEFEQLRSNKKEERGGFSEGQFLVWVKE
jgi:predicted house-cleaning noncanonical NTP pyrophosphatase (MazG superfamily)